MWNIFNFIWYPRNAQNQPKLFDKFIIQRKKMAKQKHCALAHLIGSFHYWIGIINTIQKSHWYLKRQIEVVIVTYFVFIQSAI